MKFGFLKKTNFILPIILALALILRLINLSYPNWLVFDEIYYYNFAKDYLVGNYFFDVHPALGKLFISFGLLLGDYSLFGARFFNAIAGVSIIYLAYKLVDIIFKNKFLSITVLLLCFFETSLFVESRFALLNIYIIVFTLISYIFFVKAILEKKINYFYLALVFVSISAAVKWTGIFNLLVFLAYILVDKDSRLFFLNYFKKNIFKFIIYSILSLLIPYLLLFIPEISKGEKFFLWHKQSYNFHINLNATHPYSSRWWQWFLDIRPIWLEYKQTLTGNVIGVLEIGNPFIIWFGLISLIFNTFWFIYTKNRWLPLLLMMVVFNTLPWLNINRISFYYHFIPIVTFTIINLSFMLYILYSNFKLKILVYIIILLTALFFVWYWPLLNGIEIPYKGYINRMLIKSWI